MTDTETAEAETAEAKAAKPETKKVIGFDHPFFRRLDEIIFRMDSGRETAVAEIKLGHETVLLPLPGIAREFNLEGTPDGEMLEMIAKGLKYVQALRPGDPVPPELIDRGASWEPSNRHKQIAYHRLATQLLSWLSGDEHVITDPDELLQVAADPSFRKKVNAAFDEAAEALGLGRENREEVTRHISELAHELSYIETLRERYQAMRRMEQKIQTLRRRYGNERSVLDVADPVAKLAERATTQFREHFEQIDANTGEIMSALRNLDKQRQYIQDQRDDLRARMMAWDDILAKWEKTADHRSQAAEKLLEETYRFLAQRYLPVDEWVMLTRLQQTDRLGRPKKAGGQMEWF